VITDVRLVSHGKGSSWYPILRFDTAEGRHVDTRAMHGRVLPGGRGKEVTVLYDPADPTRVDLERGPGGRSIELGAIWVVFGVVLGILGLFPGWVGRH